MIKRIGVNNEIIKIELHDLFLWQCPGYPDMFFWLNGLFSKEAESEPVDSELHQGHIVVFQFLF